MKEKEIRLSTEEIDYLLKGTIHWEDIVSRLDGPMRKTIDKIPTPQNDTWHGEKVSFRTTQENRENRFSDWESQVEVKDLESKSAPIIMSTQIKGKETVENRFQGRTFREYDVDLTEGEEEDDEVFADDRPFWSGVKVYIILLIMGCMTLGTWAYFVFA